MKLKVLSTVGLALSLGLTSLGSGGTAFAEKPTKGNYYQVESDRLPGNFWDLSLSDYFIKVGTPSTKDSQQFLFYELDNGYYAIVNKQTGKPITNITNGSTFIPSLSGGSITPIDKGTRTVIPGFSWASSLWAMNTNNLTDRQSWKITREYNGKYQFQNKHDGLTLDQDAGSKQVNVRDSQYITNQFWEPKNKQTIHNIPQLLPNQSLPAAPRFTAFNQILPEQTTPVVTGSTIMPAIMVTDNNWSDATKMQNSPYYRLVKKQYWKRQEIVNFTPGEEKEVTEKTGMSKVQVDSMVEKTGIEIKADLGLSFGGEKASKKGTGALSATFTKELTTTHSTTETALEETTIKHTLKNPSTTSDFSWAKYALATEYSLERMDGSKVSDPWTVIDGKVTQNTSWPSGQQPTVQSTKTISVN
ncbi:TPA: RICIN domain-containing protein [Bacillus cereus]|nr:RICIN domain-containing protein [Bacillus cereus]